MYSLIIIDDEKKILDGIAEIFPWNNIGFEVKEKFTVAAKALDYLKVNNVDVVLTDICMPDMTGLDLTKKIKENSATLVVVFSSHTDYDYMREALQLNVVDYLMKPIDYQKLVSCFEKVKQLLDEKYEIVECKDDSYYGKIIRKVDDYLKNNYQKGRLQEVAEEIGISSTYLSKIYKEKSGIGFQEKLNKIRMEKAAELLQDYQLKSYEISHYVGYDSPKNFTRAFKNFYGISPREYRNKKGDIID